MTTTPKPVDAWAVVSPLGHFEGTEYMGGTESAAWFTYTNNPVNRKAEGYRCIPVTITPKGE